MSESSGGAREATVSTLESFLKGRALTVDQGVAVAQVYALVNLGDVLERLAVAAERQVRKP